MKCQAPARCVENDGSSSFTPQTILGFSTSPCVFLIWLTLHSRFVNCLLLSAGSRRVFTRSCWSVHIFPGDLPTKGLLVKWCYPLWCQVGQSYEREERQQRQECRCCVEQLHISLKVNSRHKNLSFKYRL